MLKIKDIHWFPMIQKEDSKYHFLWEQSIHLAFLENQWNDCIASELVAGDYLSAGTQIHEGMEVTYEIGAYPSREYGTMTEKVTLILSDIKVNDSGNAYYLVETSVATEKLRNRNGEEAVLKVGMLCETKVVIESKSVLSILLEKMFH